jgi:4-hydroxy-tetrahydrodipicolinate synthase
MTTQPFCGVFTALVTPFTPEGGVDFFALQNLLQKQKQMGIHGVVILGTTAESSTLSEEECERIVYTALEHRSDNFHVYVGAGTNNTHQTLQRSQRFARMSSSLGQKIDGLMYVVPYYNKPSQLGIKAHFSKIAQTLKNIPICLYNVPGRTGVGLETSTFVQLIEECPNIIALKEASGSKTPHALTDLKTQLLALQKQHIRLLCGDDAAFAPSLVCGAQGCISVTSHVIPKTLINMWVAAQSNDLKRLEHLHLLSYPIQTEVFSVTNPVGIKWLLARLNMCKPYVRLPLMQPEGKELIPLNELYERLCASGLS